MASINELQDALMNANKAGDTEAARQLADAIHAMRSTEAAKPASVQAGGALNSIPRQLGLTARYGIEGLANTAQVFTEPLRYVTDMFTPDRHQKLSDLVTGDKAPPKSTPLGVQATKFADWVGLPSPQGADERVIGDATRLGFGTLGPMALGKAGGQVSKLAQESPKYIDDLLAAMKTLPSSFSSNAAQQVSSAVGAGLAGGASREAGGSAVWQALASLAGGVGGGMAPAGGNALWAAGRNLLGPKISNQQLDIKISEILGQTGVDYSQVPEKVRQSLRAELGSALQSNKEISPAALSRLVDFKLTGTTPTRGMLSQDPVQITREMNLAKMAANSGDESLHGLPLLQNQNNSKLVSNLNDLGANRGDLLRAGERVNSSILGTQAGLRSAEQSAWDAAKGLPGYRQPIDAGVLSDVNRALDEQGMMGFLSPEISRYMAAFQGGQQPFTPQAYKNLMSMLATEKSVGGNPAAAARIASDTLLRGELRPAGFANAGNMPVTQGMAAGMRSADGAATDAIEAVNRARTATRQAYDYEDLNPLVRSVLADSRTSDPQRIAQSYIIGGTANEAADIIQQVGPQNIGVIKDAVVNHLKDKALNGASDEVGKFSQSAFNKALNAIGERKLALLFTPEELTALRANARVASLMQVQPIGSAVNNSNSGALLLGRGMDILNKLPIAGPMVGPALKNIQISYGNRQAQQVLPGLLAMQEKAPMGQALMLPGFAVGGLLAAP